MPKYMHSISWSVNIESDYEDFDDVVRNEPEVLYARFADMRPHEVECFDTFEMEG